jgi:predicted DNA-binding transcriptional regulator YafY
VDFCFEWGGITMALTENQKTVQAIERLLNDYEVLIAEQTATLLWQQQGSRGFREALAMSQGAILERRRLTFLYYCDDLRERLATIMEEENL